jgi:hypothetical protein
MNGGVTKGGSSWSHSLISEGNASNHDGYPGGKRTVPAPRACTKWREE